MLGYGHATKSQVLVLERIRRWRFPIPPSHVKDKWCEAQSLSNLPTVQTDVKAQASAQLGRYSFASSHALSL